MVAVLTRCPGVCGALRQAGVPTVDEWCVSGVLCESPIEDGPDEGLGGRVYPSRMPELPEVEGVRRSIESVCVGSVVGGVRVLRRDVVVGRGDPPGGWSRAGAARREAAGIDGGVRVRRDLGGGRVYSRELLAGDRLVSVERRGKSLAMFGEPSGRAVVVHLGMTGQLLWVPPRGRMSRPDHVHVVWTLRSEGGAGGRLVFRDPRRFGGVWIAGSREVVEGGHWSKLGPDAWASGAEAVAARLASCVAGTIRPVKAVLLDQRVLAGVGNIYADEALFDAGIEPDRPGCELGRGDAERLGRAVWSVLDRAVRAGGTTLRDYVDGLGRVGGYREHAVYGRSGEPCRRCDGVLEHREIAQRTTVACPRCQGWWMG